MKEDNQLHHHHHLSPPQEEELLNQMQGLRLKATELLLREEWQESIQIYSQFINLCLDQISSTHQDQDHLTKLQKSLCLALSNRAEARFRLGDFGEAIRDCDQALAIEGTHFKSLLCKGRILLGLNRYSKALDCFNLALLDPQANGNLETLNGYVEKCKRLELQSKTGAFDISDWVLNGFQGKCPELAEYVGPVQISRSELSGRGLFATKDIEVGTSMLVTKAVAVERGILCSEDFSGVNAQLVMWKNFVDKILESATKCQRVYQLILALSTGEEENQLEVPEISVFKPEGEDRGLVDKEIDMERILSILDVNSLVEDSVSAKVLGKNRGYYGVGLWLLASFINHSCSPNARRLHMGDHVLVLASRDIKAGEEVTFAYFDVLVPLGKRKEMAKSWGFRCECKRCKFEGEVFSRQGMEEIEMRVEKRVDLGGAILRLEEGMRKWMLRGKEKDYLRASFWDAYCKIFKTEQLMKRWGRRIPAVDIVVDSIVKAVGSEERLLKILIERLERNGAIDMEKAIKLGRGVYGKAMKKQALRSLLRMGDHR